MTGVNQPSGSNVCALSLSFWRFVIDSVFREFELVEMVKQNLSDEGFQKSPMSLCVSRLEI